MEYDPFLLISHQEEEEEEEENRFSSCTNKEIINISDRKSPCVNRSAEKSIINEESIEENIGNDKSKHQNNSKQTSIGYHPKPRRTLIFKKSRNVRPFSKKRNDRPVQNKSLNRKRCTSITTKNLGHSKRYRKSLFSSERDDAAKENNNIADQETGVIQNDDNSSSIYSTPLYIRPYDSIDSETDTDSVDYQPILALNDSIDKMSVSGDQYGHNNSHSIDRRVFDAFYDKMCIDESLTSFVKQENSVKKVVIEVTADELKKNNNKRMGFDLGLCVSYNKWSLDDVLRSDPSHEQKYFKFIQQREVSVLDTQKGQLADQLGIKPGWVILSVNGETKLHNVDEIMKKTFNRRLWFSNRIMDTQQTPKKNNLDFVCKHSGPLLRFVFIAPKHHLKRTISGFPKYSELIK